MPRFDASVDVPVGAETAFAYLADPRNRPEWQSSLRSVELTEGDPYAVGYRWRDVTAVGVRPVLVTTLSEAPTAWAETGTWRGVSADLRLDLTAYDGGCRVRASGEVRGRGVWAVPAALAGAVAGVAIGSDLRRAARLLTARGDRG